MRLAPASVRAPGFHLLVQEADGALHAMVPPPPSTVRGTIDELPGARVAGGVSGGELRAVIALEDGRVLGVQPLRDVDADAESGLHVVALDDGTLPAGSCPVTEPAVAVTPSDRATPEGATATPAVADLAVDADFEFFQLNGSSTTATTNDVETLIDAVNVVYERDVDLTHRLVTVIVRSTAADPYDSTDPATLFMQLSGHWNAAQTGVTRDLVHLMTGKNLDGSTIGYSGVGVVCNRSRAYGISQARFTTNMARRTALVAHEMGHNWNANHCDGITPCNIMCSGLGGCNGIGLPNFEPTGISAIRAFAASRACLDRGSVSTPPVPGPVVELSPPQPSPFDDRTTLGWFMERAGAVRLSVFDVAGHHVADLVDGDATAGSHTIEWDGRDRHGRQVPPGIYQARLETSGESRSRKVVRVR